MGEPEVRCETPAGTVELVRLHAATTPGLRAWDGADLLLLERLAELDPAGPVLVLNDAHGALTVGVLASGRAPDGVTVMSDSFCARRAIDANLARNDLDPSDVDWLTPFDAPPVPPGVVVFRPTRHAALFEHELRTVAPCCPRGTRWVGAEVAKRLRSGTADVLGRLVGPTATSRARRRARTIEATSDEVAAPGPWRWPTAVEVLAGGPVAISWPGAFSARRLDAGTRLLVHHLPALSGDELVVDLGCGNGAVALVVAHRHPDVDLVLVDESHSAIASAIAGFEHLGGRQPRVELGDAMDEWASGTRLDDASADVVLLNPPFHMDHAVGDATAWRLLLGARRVLRPGGELRMVGNRHLGYHAKLRRLFGGCEVVASDRRFVVLSATRSNRP